MAGVYKQWAESRARFNRDLKVPGSEAARKGWQKDYVRGTTPDGVRAAGHQTKLKLREFNNNRCFDVSFPEPGALPQP